MIAFDFDAFCDAAANGTLAAAEVARLRLANVGTAMRPWAEKVSLLLLHNLERLSTVCLRCYLVHACALL